MSAVPQETPEELLGELVEQYAMVSEWIKKAYRMRDGVKSNIDATIRAHGIKLPFHCDAGTIHKGYEKDRTRQPKRYMLRARRTMIGPKRRIAVEAL